MYGLMGYLLFVGQGKNNDMVISVLAIGLGLSGVFSMIGYLLSKISERYKRNEFVFGALLLIIALFLYSSKNTSLNLKMIIAMAIGMSAIIKIQDLFDALAIGKKVSGIYFSFATICAVLCIFIYNDILIPQSISYYIYGGSLLLAGASDLISNFYLAISNSKYEAELRKQEETEKIIEEAEKDINSKDSKPISFIENVLFEKEEESNGPINIELTDKEKNA